MSSDPLVASLTAAREARPDDLPLRLHLAGLLLDVDRALKEVRPSTRPWMATARNVAMFSPTRAGSTTTWWPT